MESNLAFSETRSSIKVNLTKFLDVIFHIQPRGEVMRENKVTVLPAKCHMKRQSEIGKQINLQAKQKGKLLGKRKQLTVKQDRKPLTCVQAHVKIIWGCLSLSDDVWWFLVSQWAQIRPIPCLCRLAFPGLHCLWHPRPASARTYTDTSKAMECVRVGGFSGSKTWIQSTWINHRYRSAEKHRFKSGSSWKLLEVLQTLWFTDVSTTPGERHVKTIATPEIWQGTAPDKCCHRERRPVDHQCKKWSPLLSAAKANMRSWPCGDLKLVYSWVNHILVTSWNIVEICWNMVVVVQQLLGGRVRRRKASPSQKQNEKYFYKFAMCAVSSVSAHMTLRTQLITSAHCSAE